jgi:hypothetical protein
MGEKDMSKQDKFIIYAYNLGRNIRGGIDSIPDTFFSINVKGEVSKTTIASENGELKVHDGPHDLPPEEAVKVINSISNMDMGGKKRSSITDILDQARIAAQQKAIGR